MSHLTAPCLVHVSPVLLTDDSIFLLFIQLQSPVLDSCSKQYSGSLFLDCPENEESGESYLLAKIKPSKLERKVAWFGFHC